MPLPERLPFVRPNERTLKERVRQRELMRSVRERPPLPEEVPVSKVFGVVGTPCGGTLYTSQRLWLAGFDVTHERMGPEGMVCGWWLWGLRRFDIQDYRLKVTARVIRHPLRCLETLPNFGERMGRRRNVPWVDEIEAGPVQGAIAWWVHTHEAVPEDTPTVRICHFEEDFPGLVNALSEARGSRPEPREDIRRAKPYSKPRRWSRMTWDELCELSPEYGPRARALADRFDLREDV